MGENDSKPERYQHEASQPARLGRLGSTALYYGYKTGASAIKEVGSTGFRDPRPVYAATLLRRSKTRAPHHGWMDAVLASVCCLQAGAQELGTMSPRAHAS